LIGVIIVLAGVALGIFASAIRSPATSPVTKL